MYQHILAHVFMGRDKSSYHSNKSYGNNFRYTKDYRGRISVESVF